MKHFLSKILLTAAAFSALMVSAQAMDYNFSTTAPQLCSSCSNSFIS